MKGYSDNSSQKIPAGMATFTPPNMGAVLTGRRPYASPANWPRADVVNGTFNCLNIPTGMDSDALLTVKDQSAKASVPVPAPKPGKNAVPTEEEPD